MKPSDRNVAAVVRKVSDRAAVGMTKYGVDTAHAGLPLHKWLQHMQEEMMDGAVYAEAAIRQTVDYQQLHTVASELLRLYDWRQELGAAVKAGRATVDTQRGDLLKYGEQKKAAWKALRTILFPKESKLPPEYIRCPDCVGLPDLVESCERCGAAGMIWSYAKDDDGEQRGTDDGGTRANGGHTPSGAT